MTVSSTSTSAGVLPAVDTNSIGSSTSKPAPTNSHDHLYHTQHTLAAVPTFDPSSVILPANISATKSPNKRNAADRDIYTPTTLTPLKSVILPTATTNDDDYNRPNKRAVPESLFKLDNDDDDEQDGDSINAQQHVNSSQHAFASSNADDPSFFDLLSTFAKLDLPKSSAATSATTIAVESCPMCPGRFPIEEFATHVYTCIKQLDEVEAQELTKMDERLARQLAAEEEEQARQLQRGVEGDIDAPSTAEVNDDTESSSGNESYQASLADDENDVMADNAAAHTAQPLQVKSPAADDDMSLMATTTACSTSALPTSADKGKKDMEASSVVSPTASDAAKAEKRRRRRLRKLNQLTSPPDSADAMAVQGHKHRPAHTAHQRHLSKSEACPLGSSCNRTDSQHFVLLSHPNVSCCICGHPFPVYEIEAHVTVCLTSNHANHASNGDSSSSVTKHTPVRSPPNVAISASTFNSTGPASVSSHATTSVSSPILSSANFAMVTSSAMGFPAVSSSQSSNTSSHATTTTAPHPQLPPLNPHSLSTRSTTAPSNYRAPHYHSHTHAHSRRMQPSPSDSDGETTDTKRHSDTKLPRPPSTNFNLTLPQASAISSLILAQREKPVAQQDYSLHELLHTFGQLGFTKDNLSKMLDSTRQNATQSNNAAPDQSATAAANNETSIDDSVPAPRLTSPRPSSGDNRIRSQNTPGGSTPLQQAAYGSPALTAPLTASASPPLLPTPMPDSELVPSSGGSNIAPS